MAKERRRSPRFSLRHLIEVDFGKEHFVRATGVNISRSGLLCRTKPAIELYSRVFLSLTLPGQNGDEVVNCEGIVVRSERDGDENTTGISFTSFEPHEAERLIELLGRQGGAPSGQTKAGA